MVQRNSPKSDAELTEQIDTQFMRFYEIGNCESGHVGNIFYILIHIYSIPIRFFHAVIFIQGWA